MGEGPSLIVGNWLINCACIIKSNNKLLIMWLLINNNNKMIIPVALYSPEATGDKSEGLET